MRPSPVDILRAGFFSTLMWLKNNRWMFFTMFVWPYLLAGGMLLIGTAFGSLETFSENVGVANPVVYMIAASGVVMSSLVIVDSVANFVVNARWVGTLPYLLLTPASYPLLLLLLPLPDALMGSMSGLIAALPGAVIVEGLMGAVRIGIILLFVYLGMLPLVGLSVVIASATLIVKTDENIASFLTPLMTLVSGVFYPVTILPPVLQALAKAIPVTYVVQAAKFAASFTTPEATPFLLAAGSLTALALGYNGAAAIIIRGIEWAVKKSGAV